ncbi:hypothetical protein [Geobacter sulfurreducens]|uniref:hypothetical protein n=1 Tax=Geobacter sulfurreducens TaxID=35554 RepID=UPI000DBB4752|nr:hypothetical protein [Geobacter sulfurreducens]BBA71833.1 hypothetical protein YM18_3326 [Geobacter sulfurreducens]
MRCPAGAIAVLIALALGGCASSSPSWTGVYHATVEGVTGTARVSASGDRVRMEFSSQRKTSVSILRYDRGVAWLLAPTMAVYREIPLADLRRDVPLFFDPALRVNRTELGKELLDGRDTMKYAAEITQNGTTFRGYLWEAVPPLPVPLRWEDERGAVVSWEQVVPAPIPPGQFEIPGGYAEAAAALGPNVMPRAGRHSE